MTKKSKTKPKLKEYDSLDVRYAQKLRKQGLSIRKIGKQLDIPKSVIGRWMKEGERVYIQKYDFRDVKRKVKGNMTQKDLKKFRKMEHNIIHKPIGRQSELTVEYYDDDDGEGGYFYATSS